MPTKRETTSESKPPSDGEPRDPEAPEAAAPDAAPPGAARPEADRDDAPAEPQRPVAKPASPRPVGHAASVARPMARQADAVAPATTRVQSGAVARIVPHGAARQVTGSCYLVETDGGRLLLDCGMFQGGREERDKNYERFPFDLAQVDAVILTHGHIDHTGRVPLLYARGWKGTVHATAATRDLLGIMLRDSASIQESEAERRTSHRLRRGDSAVEPLYTSKHAERALKSVEGHPFGEPFEVLPGVEVTFVEAGHILGAAQVVLRIRGGTGERTVVFSGDLGRDDAPLMREPKLVRHADLVVMESTYGDRDHRDLADTLEEFAAVLDRAGEQGGNVIVPVFAVGRAQEVLAHLAAFQRDGKLPQDKIYLDSPMAIDVTKLYKEHADCFRAEALEEAGGKLPAPTGLRRTRSRTASMAINKVQGAVILSASGMCDAGRILHHLKHNLWRPETHLVFAGYQARGSLGRQLVDGARNVRVMGQEIAVKATIHTIGGLSAHADQTGLLNWLRGFEREPKVIALTHGEPEKQEKLASVIRHKLGWRPQVPTAGVPLVV